MADEIPNAALAEANATKPDALKLNELAVIGLMEAHDGMTALLRSSRGEIARVHVGDNAFGVQITAIGTEQVVLTDRWGRTQSLGLPSS